MNGRILCLLVVLSVTVSCGSKRYANTAPAVAERYDRKLRVWVPVDSSSVPARAGNTQVSPSVVAQSYPQTPQPGETASTTPQRDAEPGMLKRTAKVMTAPVRWIGLGRKD